MSEFKVLLQKELDRVNATNEAEAAFLQISRQLRRIRTAIVQGDD
jgi:hypothetical protein